MWLVGLAGARARRGAGGPGCASEGVVAAGLLACLVLAPSAASGQHEPVRGDPIIAAPSTVVEHSVSGRLTVDAAGVPRPVGGTWVILHRVGPDHAGPVDSLRTDALGRFSFRYPRAPEDEAIFFLSGSHGGVAYFSGSIRDRDVTGGAADIVAFDTSSAPGILRTLGRHIVIGRPRGDRREVLEVIEISNDTALTIVAAGDDRPSWTGILPSDAADFAVGEGDVGEGGLTFNDGRLELFAPVAPGIKQVTFGYTLPMAAFPVSIPIGDSLPVLEVLIESRNGSAQGAGLREVDPTVAGERTFRRFLSENAPANAVVRVDVREDRDGGAILLPLVLVASAILVGALIVVIRRQSAARDEAPLAEGAAGT
jgi:hypothetical protein